MYKYHTVAHFNRQDKSCVDLIKVNLSHYKCTQEQYTNFENNEKLPNFINVLTF